MNRFLIAAGVAATAYIAGRVKGRAEGIRIARRRNPLRGPRFDDVHAELLEMTDGDEQLADRLIDDEARHHPNHTAIEWTEAAIGRLRRGRRPRIGLTQWPNPTA